MPQLECRRARFRLGVGPVVPALLGKIDWRKILQREPLHVQVPEDRRDLLHLAGVGGRHHHP